MNDNADREPNSSIILSELISRGVNLGKVTVILGGNSLNSAFLDVYLNSRGTSLESRIFFKSATFCVISEIVRVISASCLPRQA